MHSFSAGGAERVVITLANSFANNGIDVTMIVVSSAGPLACELSDKVRVIDLGKKRAITSVRSLGKILKEGAYDSVMSTIDNINVTLVVTARLYRLKTNVVVRLANAPSQLGRGKTGVKDIIFRLLKPLVFRVTGHADHIVAVSNGVRQDFLSMNPSAQDRVSVIYNPTISSKIFELAQESVNLERFFHDGAPVILAIGRLEPQKDFETLIDAFSLIAKERDVRLCILGEGSCRPRLEKKISSFNLQDKVALPGFDNNPYRYLARSSVFVLSSLYEGLPNVLIQALAFGLPIVSTDCKHGPREILENGALGLLVKPGDCEAMARAINKQINVPKRVVNKEVLERYTVSGSTKAYRSILCKKAYE